MLDQTLTLPEDPEELRSFTARLLAEVKAQAILIEKLRHQLAGHRAHRFGASSETAEQLQLALETSEIAAAAMTAQMRLPDIEENDKPKRRPIPDHIPRMEVELTPGAEACADCGGRLRRIGEDVGVQERPVVAVLERGVDGLGPLLAEVVGHDLPDRVVALAEAGVHVGRRVG